MLKRNVINRKILGIIVAVALILAFVIVVPFPAGQVFADESEESDKQLFTKEYHSSELSNGESYYVINTDFKYTLTIIMDGDLTLKKLSMENGTSLVLKGTGKLTVTDGIQAFSHIGGTSSIRIEDNVSVDVTGKAYALYAMDDIEINTTGTVKATATGYYNSDHVFNPGVGIHTEYLNIYNGDVTAAGVDGEDTVLLDGSTMKCPGSAVYASGLWEGGVFMYGGSLSTQGCSYGVQCYDFYAGYSGHGEGVKTDLRGTESALMGGRWPYSPRRRTSVVYDKPYNCHSAVPVGASSCEEQVCGPCGHSGKLRRHIFYKVRPLFHFDVAGLLHAGSLVRPASEACGGHELRQEVPACSDGSASGLSRHRPPSRHQFRHHFPRPDLLRHRPRPLGGLRRREAG